MSNPTVNLSQAEKSLTTAIHAVADAIDATATTATDAALARLHASATACKDRLELARTDLFATVADLVAQMEGAGRDILPPVILSLPAPEHAVAVANPPAEPKRKRKGGE